MQQQPRSVQDDSVVSLLYQRHAPVILIYVRRHIPSWEDAEDIVLEVFLTALEQEKLLVGLSVEAQRAWLWRIAHNKVVDLYRRRGSSSSAPFEALAQWVSDDDGLTPEETALQQEMYSRLRASLASLSQPQQEIVRLRFEAGLRCKDIAGLMQKPEGTVRSMLSRALNHLRKLYEQEPGG